MPRPEITTALPSRLAAALLAGAAALSLAACGGSESGALNTLSGLAQQPAGPAPDLIDPEAEQTYRTLSSTQQLVVNTTVRPDDTRVVTGTFYEGEQPIATNDQVSVTFDPRDATFDLNLNAAGIEWEGRFQDPLHRTNFPQATTPAPADVEYYESGVNTDNGFEINTYFFETPGTTTRYVTWGGFYRRVFEAVDSTDDNGNPIVEETDTRIRSTFVYGLTTDRAEVPTTGTATYNGKMFAWTVGNPGTRDLDHVIGTSALTVDFAGGTVNAEFTSGVGSPQTLTASGSASFVDTREGFSGQIDTATFAGAPVDMAASSLEGNFFGPAAAETGGAFRIIGGIPDTRIDIHGSFTGAQPAN